MNREVHVRFWESAGLQCPAPLDYRQEYRDLPDALRSLRRFIEKVYNEKRLHSALGYLPPSEFETNLSRTNNGKEAASRQLSYEFFQASGNLSIRCDSIGQGTAKPPLPGSSSR